MYVNIIIYSNKLLLLLLLFVWSTLKKEKKKKTVKLDQLIEYNKRNIFLPKLCRK